MNVLKQYWWLLITFLIVTGIFLTKFDKLNPLIWNMEDPSSLLGNVFVKLLIVGALLDQLIAVFFPQDESNVESRAKSIDALRLAKENKKRVRRIILDQELFGTKTDDQVRALERMDNQISILEKTEKTTRQNINDIDVKRSAYVRKVAFATGLVLAITAVTILRDFIQIEESLNYKILSYIDVLFTAAVLSGGTSGINQLLQLIKDSWKKS